MTSTTGGKARIGPYAGGTIVASDIDRAVAPYTSWLKYSERAAGTVSRGLAQSWGAPAMEGRRFIVLGAASGSSQFIRFVEGPKLPGYKPMTTFGWNALEITVQDVDAIPAHIEGSPFVTIGEPRNLSSTDNIRAMQVVGLADEVLYLTQIKDAADTASLPRAHAFVDHIFIVILGSPDFDASRAFYEKNFAVQLGNPIQARVRTINKAFGYDIETRHTICTIGLHGKNLVELDDFPKAAVPRQTPKGELPYSLGLVSMEVDSLAKVTLKPFAPPAAIAEAPYNGRRAATFAGSAGELLELIETR